MPRFSGPPIAQDFNRLSRGIERNANALRERERNNTDPVNDAAQGSVAGDRFTITTENSNTLVGNSLSPGGPTGVSIAKATQLRGDIATRVVATVTQTITPSYTDEPVIVAINVGEDVTGETGVDWLEIQERHWARDGVTV